VSGGGDKVEKSMDTVVPETGITLDARLFSQDVIILTLEIANYFLKAVHGHYTYVNQRGSSKSLRELVVNVVTEARSIHNGKRDADTVLLQL
jgi:hypothetical protein